MEIRCMGSPHEQLEQASFTTCRNIDLPSSDQKIEEHPTSIRSAIGSRTPTCCYSSPIG